MPGYKLTIKNAKVVLKTIADYIINLVGIKDNNTGTGNVTSGFIDWKIQHYSDTAANFTSLNPVLLVGQLGIETDALATSPKFKIGDGLTAWNSLPYVGGSSLGYTPEDVANKSTNVNTDKASSTKYPSVKAVYDWATGLFVKKGTLTNNYIPKATSSDTIGDSQITDDGTTVTVNNKLSILKNTVGTGQKGVSVNFNTIGEVFYIDDNGYLVYNANAGATFKGSNGIIDIVSNGGTEPILSFKYNNGSNTSGLIKGIGGKLIIDTPLLELSQLTPSQIVGTDASKNLVSLDTATYPSLTELSYTKGVTSPIQTQLDGKLSSTKERLLDIVGFSSLAPADATTYYFGEMHYAAPPTAQSSYRFQLNENVTIARAIILVRLTTVPSNESISFYIRESATTDYTITTSLNANTITSNVSQSFIYSGLNIAITAGNNYEMKMVTPTWATNPTNFSVLIKLYGY